MHYNRERRKYPIVGNNNNSALDRARHKILSSRLMANVISSNLRAHLLPTLRRRVTIRRVTVMLLKLVGTRIFHNKKRQNNNLVTHVYSVNTTTIF